MALLFEKPSARTRHSMEMAVVQLGGHPVSIAGGEVGIDERESAEDIARTLACYHAAIGARVFDHTVVERMAAVSPVPVVNMLSDQAHPLPGAGRPADREAGFRGDQRSPHRLCGRSQQRGPFVGHRRGAGRGRVRHGQPNRVPLPHRRQQPHHQQRGSRRGGRRPCYRSTRRPCGVHRRVGLDGPRGRGRREAPKPSPVATPWTNG